MDILIVLFFSYLIYMVLALVGITLGYHRYFSHKEFKASQLAECLMLYFGMLCGVRSPLSWCGVHRMHHAYSDTDLDPHSSKNYPWYVILFSAWKLPTIEKKFVKDLYKNSRVVFFHKHLYKIYFVNTMILFLIFGWISLIFLFLISLYSYIGFGVLNLCGHDENGARNCPWINLIAPFEGNHKNHHKYSSQNYLHSSKA